MMIVVKLELVLEICVFDMLNQPVLGPVNILHRYGIFKGIEFLVESVMLLGMFRTVCVSFRVTEEASFIIKMGSHLELKIIKMLGAVWIVAEFPDMVKQDFVLLIKPGVEHLK